MYFLFTLGGIYSWYCVLIVEGLEAIIFTADGDMRQAVNNLQSTHSGFGLVSPNHVFKVCDQPHPVLVQQLIKSCVEAHPDRALHVLSSIYTQGFSSVDIVTTLFRVVKSYEMAEMLKLEYIKEIGMTHMRLLEGCTSLLQLSGLVVRLARVNMK